MDDLGDPSVLEGLKAAKTDDERRAIEKDALIPTVFPRDLGMFRYVLAVMRRWCGR